jgi:predicted N-acetyltransferase YhbS
VKVRRLTAGDDAAAAIHLLCRFFAEEGFTAPEVTIAHNAREMLTLDTCGMFVAEDGGKAIGVATISLEFGVEYGWWSEMGDLYVVPEARGAGVSRGLVAAIEDFLRERGASGYQVTVTPQAEQSHGLARFYAALGFASEGRLILKKTL